MLPCKKSRFGHVSRCVIMLVFDWPLLLVALCGRISLLFWAPLDWLGLGFVHVATLLSTPVAGKDRKDKDEDNAE